MIFNAAFQKKLFTYFTQKLGVREYRNGWLKGDCPDCGRPDKFGINLVKNKTNCFVCGYDPKPLDLVGILEGVKSYNEAKGIVNLYKEGDYIIPILKKLEVIRINLPDEYINISLGTNLPAKLARKYIKSRGFKISDVAMKGWGYCPSGEYAGYIIMPFYMGGKLVYYNARKYFGAGPKYKNPKVDSTGIGKSLVIYNSIALGIYKEVFLLEGLINAETLGSQGISTGGKDISRYQLSAIIKSPIESICLLLDPDAILKSIEWALELSYHKKVKVVYWEGSKDVNDMGRQASMELINNTPYMGYNDLLKLRNKINEKRSIITY